MARGSRSIMTSQHEALLKRVKNEIDQQDRQQDRAPVKKRVMIIPFTNNEIPDYLKRLKKFEKNSKKGRPVPIF